jgi:proteic killer suppression protein
VIVSFKGRLVELVWKGESPKRFPSDLLRPAQRKLAMLNAATSVGVLRSPPGNQLEALKGDRRGQWSIRINDQFRICFRWKDDNAEDVEIVDYH